MPATDTYCTAHSIDDFRHNLATVQRRIAEACKRAGRDPQTVRLLPVSKTIPEDRLRLAYAAGCRQMGENKVQEALRKAETMSDLSDLRWSVIGHLQTNKAKYVARFASEFQALDNLRVAQELDRRLQAEGRGLDVLVQVNTSRESSKFGLPPDEVLAFVRQLPAFTSLRVHGLMTLAVFSPDLALVRPCFVKLRQFDPRDQARVVIDTRSAPWQPGQVTGLSVMTLHEFRGEHVALVRWDPETRFHAHQHVGGEEILVLDGLFCDEHGEYPAGTWLRSPDGSVHTPFTRSEGALLYVKVGHLGAARLVDLDQPRLGGVA